MSRARICRVGALAVTLGLAANAYAQINPDLYTPPPAAKRLAEDGLKLFKDGRYQEAASLLIDAEKLFRAPQYSLYIGRAYVNLGKLVEARARLVDASTMTLPSGVPDDVAQKFEKAKALAAAELADLSRTIPTVRLSLGDPAPPVANVQVTAGADPVQVIPEEGSFRVEMNAGEHDLQIAVLGFEPAHVHVNVALRVPDGPIETLRVTLIAKPSPSPTIPSQAPSSTPPLSERASRSGSDKIAPPDPGPMLSHDKQLGLFARGDFQVIDGGAVAVTGLSFGLHRFVEVYAGAILGRDVGVEPGVAFYLLQGQLKPRLDLAVPIFFEDTAYVGVRAAAGAQWDPSRHFGVFLQAGGAFFPVVPGGYNQFVFLPSFGVQGRL